MHALYGIGITVLLWIASESSAVDNWFTLVSGRALQNQKRITEQKGRHTLS